jgi:hypothetical protein
MPAVPKIDAQVAKKAVGLHVQIGLGVGAECHAILYFDMIQLKHHGCIKLFRGDHAEIAGLDFFSKNGASIQ